MAGLNHDTPPLCVAFGLPLAQQQLPQLPWRRVHGCVDCCVSGQAWHSTSGFTPASTAVMGAAQATDDHMAALPG